MRAMAGLRQRLLRVRQAVEKGSVEHARRAVDHPLARPRVDIKSLLWVNPSQQPGTRCQWAAAAPGEFKKLVYESKFRKRENQMSFVNCQTSAGGFLAVRAAAGPDAPHGITKRHGTAEKESFAGSMPDRRPGRWYPC